jgi:hypothetical protein
VSELILEPYAVQQRWQLPAPQPGSAWQRLLGDYVMSLARACAACKTETRSATGAEAQRPCTPVIGHIKLLALFPGGGYLRASAVSAAHPPTYSGQVPDDLAKLTVTLNVLVYGLAHDVLQSLSRDVASALAAAHAGQVTEEDASSVGHTHASSHDHETDQAGGRDT